MREKTANIGDVIKCGWRKAIIGKIIYQDWSADDGWMIEGYDDRGNYFYWKQWCDGGQLEQK